MYIVNTESGVVHRPIACAKDVVSKRWRTVRGWPLGLVTSRSRRCRQRVLGGVPDKRTTQFLAEKHGATLRVLSCRLTLLTRLARESPGQLLGKGVRLEAALQLSSFNKRGLIIRVGGQVSLQGCVRSVLFGYVVLVRDSKNCFSAPDRNLEKSEIFDTF